MKKVLFLIHDLGEGGAEKVLVNLVNNMDTTRFDVTVMSLFDVGVNKQFLRPHIKYKYCFKNMIRGNSHLMKILSPEKLHQMLIKEHYDIEIAYLEGPCARIISGCPNKDTKLVSWIHIELKTIESATEAFRSVREATECYNRFNKIVCVSNKVKEIFTDVLKIKVPVEVYYNTNETDEIIRLSQEKVEENIFSNQEIKFVGVGKLLYNKGFDRMIKIVQQLVKESYPVHLYILGCGSLQNELEKYIVDNHLENNVTLLGYQTNPYKYVAKCDLFLCASHAEGFSTAATEALIVGTPVCTVEVSGMREMLGDNNEYGIVVENDDVCLYKGIKKLLDDGSLLKYYTEKAYERGKIFSTEKTVQAVEEMLIGICN